MSNDKLLRWVKHIVIDKVLTLTLLVLTLLPFVIIAVAIKVDTPGPVFFRQRRLGKDCRSFSMIKFRTMKHGCDKHLTKTPDDDRVTFVGKFLRRTSLDELPQLFNVMLGDMSLVGPRPLIPLENGAWMDLDFRYAMRPGMTGLWQVCGRHNLPDEIRLELDLLYVHGWNLLVDIKILIKTLPVVISGKGAY